MMGVGEKGTGTDKKPSEPVPFSPWPVPSQWRKNARSAMRQIGVCRRPIVLHVGSGAREKCWPLENFASLGGELSKGRAVDVRSRHRKVVFVLGPVEMERLEKSQIDRLRRDFAVLESPPLEMLAGLLADCSVYVGNDSGVSHLAAGVGAPCLALFGPTSPRHFAPLGPRVKVIAAPNMGEIVVNRVVRAARGMLRP